MKSKHLLEQRNAAKKRKPEFLRQCVDEKKKLERKWRLPRGLHSKIRRNYRGHRIRVMVGFKSPSEVRGLTREGLKPVLVSNKKQLSGLDKSYGIIVCSQVSKKNKINIIVEANKKGITVLNYKKSEEKINSIKEKFNERKLYRAKLLKSRKEKKDIKKETKKEELKKDYRNENEKVDVANVKENTEIHSHTYDHDIEEKKERDKILTQKD